MTKRKIEIVVAGDSKGGRKAFEDTERSADNFGSKMRSIGGVVAGGAAVAGGGVLALAAGVGALGYGAFQLGQDFDDAFDNIRVTTGATGPELAGLQADFKKVVSDVPADFGDASNAIATLNQKLGLTGEPLQTMSEQMLNLARITKTDVNSVIGESTDLFNNWKVPVDEQSDTLDYLFRITQQTGIGFTDLSADLSENGVKLRELGFPLTDAAALLGTLAKNGVDATDIMPAFSKSLAFSASKGVDAHKALGLYFETIKKSPNDIAAAQVAMDIFGNKAGPQMAGLIREGKLSFEELEAAVGSGGDTINKAAGDTEDFGEKMTKFGNRVKVGLEPIATKVFDGLGQALDGLQPELQKMADWFTSHPQEIQDFANKIKDAVTWVVEHVPGAISTIVEWGGYFVNGVKTIHDWWVEHIGTFEDLQNGAAMVRDGFVWIGDKIMWVKDHVLDPFIGSVQTVVAGLGEAWQQVQDEIIDPVFGFVQTAVDKIAGFFSFIKNSVFDPVIGFGQTVFGVFGDIIEFFENLPGRIGAAASYMWDTLSSTFKGVANQIIDIWNGLDFGIHIGVPDWVPGIGGKSFDIDDVIPDLPYFHTGTRRFKAPVAGGEGLAVLRDGESVNTPGGGDRDIYVYIEQTATGMVARLSDHQAAGGVVPWVKAER